MDALKLSIPEQHDFTDPTVERDVDRLHDWLTNLPLMDVVETVRLVHRSYPLDHQCNPKVTRPFHTMACAYARMAYCAGEQRKFWEANDYLFRQGRRHRPVTAGELALSLELDRDALERCLQGEKAGHAIASDISVGQRRGVGGTPTFMIGTRLYPGRVPVQVIEEALGHASAPAEPSRP